jgi:hypothetical protein
MPRVLQRTAASAERHLADLWAEQGRRNQAAFGGRRSRSAASNIFPHLNTNSPATARAMRPQGSVASRVYPHLPSTAAARMQRPKPKPRATRARRIYGDLE